MIPNKYNPTSEPCPKCGGDRLTISRDWLRWVREQACLSQGEMADLFSYSRELISGVENSRHGCSKTVQGFYEELYEAMFEGRGVNG